MFDFLYYSACAIGDATQQSYYTSCVEAVSASNSTESGLDAVIEYADFCQIALDLQIWPAQPLCNAFGDAPFPVWIGDECNILCSFGVKHPQDRNVCVCDKGYWGESCSNVCAGGSQNPCNGVGVCDVLSGKCLCPINWQSASDCSRCSPGWIGSDCSITQHYSLGIKVQVDVQISIIVGVSQVTTFNGYTFLHHSVGELYLLQISKTALIIQAKYVRCYGQYSCIKYIGLRFGDADNGFGVVTISGAQVSGSCFLITVNDEDVAVDGRLEFGKTGYTFERLSYLELLITGPSGFDMLVRADGLYLALDVHLPDDLCPFSSGLLLGGCCNSQNATDTGLNIPVARPEYDLCHEDHPVQEPSPMLNQTYVFPQNISVENNTCSETKEPLSDDTIVKYISHWKVDACDSIIVYPDSKTRSQTIGSYYLHFDNSLVYTKHLTLFVGSASDVTFELFLKCDDVISDGGVVFSYSHHTTFALVVQETINIYIGDTKYITNLVIQNQKWNKIVIVYQDSAGKLNIYHFDGTGNIKRYEIKVQQNLGLFRVAGYFAVGIWQPSWDQPNQVSLPGFTGAVDDLRIWNKYFTPAEVTALWDTWIEAHDSNVVRFWKFDEGEGDVVVDQMIGDVLSMPEDPWPQPVWLPSDVPSPDGAEVVAALIEPSFNNVTLEDRTKELCHQLLYGSPIADHCDIVSNGTKDMYFTTCLREVAISEDQSQAYKVAFAFSDICQTALKLSHWPAAPLCREEPDIRAGTECHDNCLFGSITSPGECHCIDGYFGEECDQVCPGGSIAPCGDHGECSDFGTCLCDLNWKGGLDCGVCGEHWYGLDCTFAATDIHLYQLYFISSVTLHAHYMLFDGFTMYFSITGEFYLINTESLVLQIRQMPCFSKSVCVNALALRVDSMELVFHAPYIANERPVIWVNKRETPITDIHFDIGDADWRIYVQDTNHYILQSEVDSQHKISIHIIDLYLQISVSLPEEYCNTSFGLLGNCNGNVTDDFFLEDGPSFHDVSHSKLLELLDDIWRVPTAASLFIHQHKTFIESPIPTGGVYSLYFDNTGGTTNPLSNIAVSSSEWTVEFLVWTESYGGAMISFGRDSTFTVLNEVTIKIVIDQDIYDTAIGNALHEWNHISIIYIHRDQILQIYHTSAYGVVSSKQFILQVDVFQPGIVISVGQWLPVPNNHTLFVNTTFNGQLEELRIWNRAFLPAHVQFTDASNVDADDYKDSLAMLVKFDSGTGSVVKDSVSKNDILLPSDPWQTPTWTFSDASIIHDNLTPFEASFDNETLLADAMQVCGILKPSGNDFAADLCINMTEATLDFFYMSCLRDISSTGRMESAYSSIWGILELCHSLISTSPPQDVICSLLPISHLPDWLISKCGACKFGTTTDDTCTCDKGYWGSACDKVCPGGSVSPCSLNGKCEADGSCLCNINWLDQVDCSTCGDDWYGEDCVIALGALHGQLHPDLKIQAFVSGRGRVSTPDGIAMYIHHIGTYNVLSHSMEALSVHLRMAWCATGTTFSTCFDAIFIQIKQHLLVIRAPHEADRPHVWLNGVYTELDHTTFIGECLAVIRLNILQYQITIKSLDIQVYVTIHPHHMDVSLDILSTICDNREFSGLLASCDTLNDIEDINCPGNSSTECHQNATQTLVDKYVEQYQDGISLLDEVIDNHHLLLPVLGAGYHLYFQDSVVLSEQLIYFPSERFTMEMWVKPIQFGGIILSYCTEETIIALGSLNTGLAVYHGTTVHKLNLQIDLEQWNQISLVWLQSTQILEVYVFDIVGKAKVQAITLPEQAFLSHGYLALGQWYTQAPLPVPDLPMLPYVGHIDEVKIWNRRSNPSLITSNWKLQAGENTPDLSYLWKLNEGTGPLAIDIIHGSNLKFPQWNPPKWLITEDDYPIGNESPMLYPEYDNVTFAEAALSKCSKIFQNGSLYDHCKSLGSAILDVFYLQCLQDVAFNKDLSASVESVIAFADHCQKQLMLPQWPARALCNDFPHRDFPNWIGVDCNIPCVFGRKSVYDDSMCICESGYWGEACDEICPGGVISPCSNHGICNISSGICHCDSRWRGESAEQNETTYACNKCSPGWSGTDCSISTMSINQTSGLAVFFGNTHLTTADGASIHFDIPGIYSLLKSEIATVQVLVQPCHARVSCREVTEVLVISRSVVLSVRVALGTEKVLIVHLNDGTLWKPVEYGRKATHDELVYDYRKSHLVNITVAKEINVMVALYADVVSLTVHAQRSVILSVETMVGTWNDDWMDDLNVGVLLPQEDSIPPKWIAVNDSYFLTDISTQSYFDTTFGQVFSIPVKETNFFSEQADNFQAGGYLLRFNQNRVKFTSVTIGDLHEFSLQFWMRPLLEVSSVQTILFFDASHILHIQLHSMIVVVNLNNNLVTTDLNIAVDVWCHVAIAWREFDGRLTAYLFSDETDHTDIFVTYGINTAKPLQLGGDLYIGAAEVPEGSFNGDIDNIYLRDHVEDSASLTEYRKRYTEELEEGVIFGIDLEEGYGNVTILKLYCLDGNDTIGDLLPEDNRPTWHPSDAPIDVKPDHIPKYMPEEAQHDVEDACNHFFYDHPLYTECRDILESTWKFYYDSCLSDVAASGDVNHANASAHMFALLCQRTTSLPEKEFCGFFEFCEEIKDEKCTWCIVVSVICVVLLLPCLCCVWVVIAKRKQKKRRKKEAAEHPAQVARSWAYHGPASTLPAQSMVSMKSHTSGGAERVAASEEFSMAYVKERKRSSRVVPLDDNQDEGDGFIEVNLQNETIFAKPPSPLNITGKTEESSDTASALTSFAWMEKPPKDKPETTFIRPPSRFMDKTIEAPTQTSFARAKSPPEDRLETIVARPPSLFMDKAIEPSFASDTPHTSTSFARAETPPGDKPDMLPALLEGQLDTDQSSASSTSIAQDSPQSQVGRRRRKTRKVQPISDESDV